MQTSSSSKSFWRSSFLLSLFTSCYNCSSSTCLGVETCYVCSSTTSCCNSSSSIGLDLSILQQQIEVKFQPFSFESEITMTCDVGFIVEVMVSIRKLRATFNSSSNSLPFCFCSKILVSFTVGARKTGSSTYIVPVSLTYFVCSLFICVLIKTLVFFSSSLSLDFRLNFSKAFQS